MLYTKPVASLQKHRVAGRTYWRIVESRRVRGKPRPVPLLYLGSADQLLNRLLQAPLGELRIRSFQHGDVAALKAAADRLGVVEIIDRHVPERAPGLSVGTTLLLAAAAPRRTRPGPSPRNPRRAHRSSCASRRRAESAVLRGSRFRSRPPSPLLPSGAEMSPTLTSGPLLGPAHD